MAEADHEIGFAFFYLSPNIYVTFIHGADIDFIFGMETRINAILAHTLISDVTFSRQIFVEIQHNLFEDPQDMEAESFSLYHLS